MDVLARLKNAGVIPVVVIENAKDALPTAQALLRGGIDVMEITLRTAAALDAISAVAQQCSDMLVGAGTVLTPVQAKAAIQAGAEFIVSPGFSRQVVEHCMERHVLVTPGCITPTEITAAMECGLTVVKFFPAGIFGGLSAMRELASPFGSVKFIPTGGVCASNLEQYATAPFVHAVGGSWLCRKEDISAGNFDGITALCRQARKMVLGYEFAHLGMNMANRAQALTVCAQLTNAFALEVTEGKSSHFVSESIEVLNSPYLGDNGHIAIRTNDIDRAITDLGKKGFAVDWSTAKFQNEKKVAVYLQEKIGGFAIHLLQK